MLGIEVKSHLSSVTEDEMKKIEKLLNNKGVSKIKSMEIKKEKKKKTKIKKRTVNINKEKKKQEEKKRKEQARKKDIGFIENKRNKDYNIVYRDKPTKPLTVSELLGIGKKKEEKPEKAQDKAKNQVEEKVVTPKVEEKASEKITSETSVNDAKNKTEEIVDKKVENKKETNNFNKSNYNKDKNNNFSNKRNFNNNGNDQKNNFNKRDNNYQGRSNGAQRRLDDRGIDRKIKNIMEVDIPTEKENARDFSNNKAKDRAKQNRQEESKNNKKSNNRRNNDNDFDSDKLNNLKKQNKLSNMFKEGEMLDYYDLSTERGRRAKKKNTKQENRTKQKIFKLTDITIPETITVKDLAAEMKITSSDVIKKLLNLGIMATINNELDFDTAYLIAQEYGINANKKNVVTDEDILIDETEDREEDLKPRPPVIVVMGHVDHGKTSLLDAIRSTNVIEGESGGITQHIGAYQVKINDRDITFLDTPGHEAFTSMRARGAMITDIAILVVAANDGVMPQTVEAINHAKAAEIPIIVAVNKMDLPDANFEKVQQELMKYELVPEEWGGDTIYVPISAKKKEGIDNLLEMVLLQADVLELKANPNKQAKGTVIEAKLDKSRGPVATVLVQRGKLDVGDTIIVGSSIGRIRTMQNDKGKRV